MISLKNFILFFIILLSENSFLNAQPSYNNCANALEICPNKLFTLNNLGANKTFCTDCEDDFNYCFTPNNTIWLKFSTNEQGGNVQIDFSNLIFENTVGQGSELQVSLIKMSQPCVANSYTEIGNCIVNGTGNFSLTGLNLIPNSNFYIVVSGSKSGIGVTKAAECTFNLFISGTGIDKIVPTISISANAQTNCKNDIVTLKATMLHCTDSSNFQWSINDSLASITKENIFETTALKTGDVVSVSNECFKRCPTKITATTAPFTIIDVPVNAGKDTTIFLGQSITLKGTTNASNYKWIPDIELSSTTTLNPISSPTSTRYYTLAASQNGCTNFDDVLITINDKLIIPTTFSPNNDGINDVFEIIGIENYPNCTLQIFDRWGQEVFQKIGYSFSKAWKGDREGKDLTEGVYFYTLRLNDTENQIKKGSVTIIR